MIVSFDVRIISKYYIWKQKCVFFDRFRVHDIHISYFRVHLLVNTRLSVFYYLSRFPFSH